MDPDYGLEVLVILHARFRPKFSPDEVEIICLLPYIVNFEVDWAFSLSEFDVSKEEVIKIGPLDDSEVL